MKTGLELKYFILKPKAKHKDDVYAKASRYAMREYASIIRVANPDLAEDLEVWANKEMDLEEKMFQAGRGG